MSDYGQGGLVNAKIEASYEYRKILKIKPIFIRKSTYLMENNEKPEDINDKLIDIELAKSDNKNSKIRKFLPAVALMASFYYSFLLALGLLIGYLGSKVYSKYFLENGRVDCIYIDFGKNWKIHMHHWILGAILLVVVWFIDYFYLPRFFVGAVLGIIAHDIYDYNDWHKVLVRSNTNDTN